MKKLILTLALVLALAAPAWAQKVSAFSNTNSLQSNALFSVSVKLPAGTYETKNIAFGQLQASLSDLETDQFVGVHYIWNQEKMYLTRGGVTSQRLIVAPTTSPAGTYFADGEIWYKDLTYYVAHTMRQFFATNLFGIVRSDPSLQKWSTHYLFNCDSASNYFGGQAIKTVWAPKFFTDADGSNYITVSCGTNAGSASGIRCFWTRALDNTFSNWTSLVMITNSLAALDNFDGRLVKSNDVYQLWTKISGGYIEVHTAPAISGPWTSFKSGNWAGWGTSYEAPIMFRKADGRWWVIISNGSTFKQYYTTTTNDNFSSFTAPIARLDSVDFMNGGLCPINQRTLDAALTYIYPVTSNVQAGAGFAIGASSAMPASALTLSIVGGQNATMGMYGSVNSQFQTDPAWGNKPFYFSRRAAGGYDIFYNSGANNDLVYWGSPIYHTNALSAWPTAPVSRGDCAIVSSNGYPYLLLSTNGSAGSATWTGTNKIAW